MSTNMRRLRYRVRRFERWFDRHFGWYLTNGMKHRRLLDLVSRPPLDLPEEQRSEAVPKA